MSLVAKSTIPFIGDCFAWCMPYLYDHIFVAYQNKKQISDWCLLTLDSLDHIHETPNIFLVFLQNPRSHLRSVPPLRASPGLTPGRLLQNLGFRTLDQFDPPGGPRVCPEARIHIYIYIYLYVVYIRCYRYTNVSKESCISVQSMSVCIHIYK